MILVSWLSDDSLFHICLFTSSLLLIWLILLWFWKKRHSAVRLLWDKRWSSNFSLIGIHWNHEPSLNKFNSVNPTALIITLRLSALSLNSCADHAPIVKVPNLIPGVWSGQKTPWCWGDLGKRLLGARAESAPRSLLSRSPQHQGVFWPDHPSKL